MQFDYIIVGAGTAGCVLANRLSADQSVSVLLLEAGPEDRHELLKVPAGFNYVSFDPRFIWDFKTDAEPGLGGRVIDYMRGRTLGGSSSVNAMVHVRGHREDFDGWKRSGCHGWGWEDVLPYFIKSENHESEGEWRGKHGPVSVTRCQGHAASDAYIAAMQEAGIPANDDFDGPCQEGAGYYFQAVFNGRRQSASVAYLSPARHRQNLRVETDCRVERIDFEGLKAVGVSVRDVSGAVRSFRANVSVVLAAGTVGNVPLLECSGIGSGHHLQDLGIEVKVDRPAVGENVQDHYQVPVVVKVNSGDRTLNHIGRGWRLAAQVLRYYLRRDGLLAYNAMQAGGFARTAAHLSRPDVQIFFAPGALDPAVHPRRLNDQPGLTGIVCPVQPRSLGAIHTRSSSLDVAPLITGNYLVDEHDQQTQLAGLRLLRRIFLMPAFSAYRLEEMSPGVADSASDDELLAYCRVKGDSVHHPVGSWRMGTDDEAVVDPELRVRGVSGLHIADASVMPRLPSANTNAATLMLAERAADLLLSSRKSESRF